MTAVEPLPDMQRVLREGCEAPGIGNVEILRMSAAELSDRTWLTYYRAREYWSHEINWGTHVVRLGRVPGLRHMAGVLGVETRRRDPAPS